MRSAFAAFGGFAAEVLASANSSTALIPTRYWHLEQRPWHAGGCVLIGDAAHACAPTLAQGGAMALEDALVLGELLGQQLELAGALLAFEARRAPRVAHAQTASLQRLAANRPLDPRGLALRDSILPKVGAAQLLDAWAPLMEGLP
jgi:2-polyprenyl-6-methoxyphenol hydroxylase-like FAD-dependent oxidoreductase